MNEKFTNPLLPLFTLTTLLIITQATSPNLTLYCNFLYDGWDSSITTVYKCEVPSLHLTTTRHIVTKITGNHLTTHTNDRVNAFRIFNQICHFIPQEIAKFFKNLEALAIQNSKLKDVTGSDLKELRNLKSLSLYGNELKSLEFGLFDGNLKLEFLSLYNNQINSVGGEILVNLVNLKKAFFHSNLCVNFDAVNEVEMSELKRILTSCHPTEDLKKLRDREEKLKNLEMDFDRFSQKFSTLRSELQNCEKSNVDLKVNLMTSNSTCVTNEILALDMAKCDAKLRDLTATVMKFEIECVEFNEEVCLADDVITFYENMEVKEVKFNGRHLDPSMISTLVIKGRNFHFMPRNLNDFFKNLENLTVSNTKVSKIDENLGNLKSLILTENRISKISPLSIESLEVLDLSGNQIQEINGSFLNLTNLREIYLDRNQISTLRWKSFENLTVEVISMRSNKLKEIGANLNGKLSGSLKILDLRENFCVNSQVPGENLATLIENFFKNCTIFINIDCKFTDSTCLAENLEVDAENTKIHPNITSHVEKFSAFNQNFKFFPQNLQEIFPNLTSIEISHSKLRKVAKFSGLTALKLPGNSIKSLDSGIFDQSMMLEVIDLSSNQISTLPTEIFAKLSNLKVLKLNNNKLTVLDQEIINNRNAIQEFDCAFNGIDEIHPELVKKLKRANLIDLRGNLCVDNAFDRLKDGEKKIMEIYGEVVFKCT